MTPTSRKSPFKAFIAVILSFWMAFVPAAIIPSASFAAYSTGTGASTPEQLMTDLQRDYGLSREQAAGMVGNFGVESGNFQHQEELQPNKYGTKGYGFAQWTGPRRTSLFNYASANGLDVNSYAAQYGYLQQELNGEYSYVMDLMRNASSPEEAAKIFMDKFERPSAQYAHLDRRIALANAYLNGDFSGAGAPGAGGAGGTAIPVEPPPNIGLMPWV